MSMKPKCRMCGAFHWSYEPHVYPDPKTTEVLEEIKEEYGDSLQRLADTEPVEAEPDFKIEVMPSSPQVERNRRWRAKNKEKYNAYMREYMKKRRAEGKA